jgi:hypothetical protein
MESYKSFAKDKSDYLLPNRGEIISQDKPKSERPKPKPGYHSNRIKINSEPPEGKPDRPKPVPYKSSHLEDTIIKCSRQFSPSRNNSSII